MEIFVGFITLGVISLLAAMSPGPDFAVVMKNSVLGSRRAGFFTAIGVGLGILVHVAYSLAGIALIISQSIFIFSIIKYIGAGYLLFLGVQLLRTKKETLVGEEEQATQKVLVSDWKGLRDGFLTNALNPKATLFFLSIFTQVINPETSIFVQRLYGLEVAIIVWLWFAFLAILLTTGFAKRALHSVHYHLAKVMGGLLVALGIKVAFSNSE